MKHTPPRCPAPCPDFCTRPKGHGQPVAGGGWQRNHLGDPVDPGPACLVQGETVAADGTVSRGPLRLTGPHGSMVVTILTRARSGAASAAGGDDGQFWLDSAAKARAGGLPQALGTSAPKTCESIVLAVAQSAAS